MTQCWSFCKQNRECKGFMRTRKTAERQFIKLEYSNMWTQLLQYWTVPHYCFNNFLCVNSCENKTQVFVVFRGHEPCCIDFSIKYWVIINFSIVDTSFGIFWGSYEFLYFLNHSLLENILLPPVTPQKINTSKEEKGIPFKFMKFE